MTYYIKSLYWAFLLLISTTSLLGQNGQAKSHTHKHNRVIEFPDIPGYKTLKTDLHMHSVFSDGAVWPTIRVQEALKDGLDAISVTEHIEYQPHSEDIPHPDRNRSYVLAHKEAEKQNLTVINGSEVTREMPPGHVNAIFISDANKLKQENPINAFKEAKKQGAFIFWNHPNWIAQNPDGVAVLTDMHKQLIKEGLLHGIEIVNEHTYSDEALQIALDNNLTIMGTSDIHGLIDWEFNINKGGHRPITLVFAKENNEASLKEALLDRRTAVWYNNTLIGRSTYLVPLIEQSLQIQKVESVSSYKGTSLVKAVFIENKSDVDYILENTSKYSFHADIDLVTIKAHSTKKIQVKTLKSIAEFELTFKVLNAITAPREHPSITFKVKP